LADLVPAGVSGHNDLPWGARSPSLPSAERARIIEADRAKKQAKVAGYDADRAAGKSLIPSTRQPSSPKAFLPPAVRTASRPRGVVTPALLANTSGLTEGDRNFLARSLAEAAAEVNQPKVTAASLAKEVIEGPPFADVLEGGPLPDRDEFKDRFVA